jgi:hypothetical protein
VLTMVEGHYVLEYHELTYHVMNKSGSTMVRHDKTKVTPMIVHAQELRSIHRHDWLC